MRVVVCDDDPIMRGTAASLLEYHGHSVLVQVENAVQAIDAVRRSHADLVLLDLSLPGLSGVDAIPTLIQVEPSCRVIVLTAFDNQREAALAAGADDVFTKTELTEFDAALARLAQEPMLSDLLTSALSDPLDWIRHRLEQLDSARLIARWTHEQRTEYNLLCRLETRFLEESQAEAS